MRKRRNKLQTIADMLEESKRSNCRYSHIMYGANLNTKATNGYLDILVKSRLLEKNGEFYDNTRKGINFLFKYGKHNQTLKELEEMLLPVEPNIIL